MSAPVYCKRCILPDTRPGVMLDAEGVCNGCRNAETKAHIDWSGRSREFRELVAHTQKRSTSYDCVVPVSGGKDSFWQVVTCLEQGLHPLCVTYTYPGQNELGRQNLRRLLELGVDHYEFKLNPRVEKVFIDKAFRKTGISGLVTHMAIYTVPIRLAMAFDIPLVVYGENSAFEFGSEDESLVGARVDRRWLESFGVTAGTTARDWVDDELSATDLASLMPLDETTLARKDLRVVFLGYYFPWDPENSRSVALQHGFQARAEGPLVGHSDFVNIDDDLLGVHHHLKWHKYGITRRWDTLSVEIRAGRMSREEAIEHLAGVGDSMPWSDIDHFCRYLGIDRQEYLRIAESFRNGDIWHRDARGVWTIPGFLIEDFAWSEVC